MRKALAMLLVIMMLIGVVGCGQSPTSPDNSSTPANSDNVSPDNQAEEPEEPYNVVMVWPAQGEVPAGMADVEAAINEITVPAINCTVTLRPMSGPNLVSETALAISSGEKIDLCVAIATGLIDPVQSNAIIPLDDLYAEYGADIARTAKEAVSGGYYKGKLYGLPNAWIAGKRMVYYARKDILDKYNIEIDDNKQYGMEELSEIFATVKAGEGDAYYCIAGLTSQAAMFTELFSQMYAYDTLGARNAAKGVLMLEDDFASTEIVNLYETDEYRHFAETMYDWAQKGYFTPDASTTTEIASAQVKAGNHLGYFGGMTHVDGGTATSQCGTDMVCITTVDPCFMSYMVSSNIFWSIPVTSENPEKAMQFLNYIYQNDDIAALLQYGIEGVSYVVIEQEGERKVIDYPEGETAETVPYYQNYGIWGNRFNWPTLAPRGLDYLPSVQAFSDSIKDTSPCLGFSFDPENVMVEYTAVTNVIAQYEGIINTGAIDPAIELPEFQAALKDAGIDKVIEENRKQFAEWLATK